MTDITVDIDGRSKATKSASYDIHNTDCNGRFTIHERPLLVWLSRNKATKSASYDGHNTDRYGRFTINDQLLVFIVRHSILKNYFS